MAGLLVWNLREYKTDLLEPIMATNVSHWWSIACIYSTIWLLGLLMIVFTFISFGKYFRELEAQKTLLQQSRDYFKAFYQQAPVAFQSLADPSQLQQILLNLVVNARDALHEKLGGEKIITISTAQKYLDDAYVARHAGSRQGWHVQLQVEDSGAGMSEEVSDHIFEPFFTTKSVGQGTGMGLATVYGIVKQNNGSVYVYSEPGQGTVFKIYWPIMAEKATKGENKESAEPVVGGNETILLAEDSVGIRKIISRQLSQAGYTVIEAENGGDALEQAENHQGVIDLLFTDVIMPIMGGKELAEKIKDIYPDIPVLFGSGYTDDNLPEEVILSAESHFINKPYNIRDVMARVRSLLDDRLA